MALASSLTAVLYWSGTTAFVTVVIINLTTYGLFAVLLAMAGVSFFFVSLLLLHVSLLLLHVSLLLVQVLLYFF